MGNSFSPINPVQPQTGTVGASLANIGAPIVLSGAGAFINLELKNTGTIAFSNVLIQMQQYDGGDFLPLVGGTDFGTATGVLVFSSNGNTSGSGVGQPNTLPAGSACMINLNIGAAAALQLQAQVASGSSSFSLGGNILVSKVQ